MRSDERKPYSTAAVKIIALDERDVIATSWQGVESSSPPKTNDGGWTEV